MMPAEPGGLPPLAIHAQLMRQKDSETSPAVDSSGSGTPPLAVCVFAHNEGPRIRRCLDSLATALDPATVTPVTVMANGCTDDTAAEAGMFRAPNVHLRVVELRVGDKSNAWNCFTYDVAPAASAAIFVDGDVWLGRNSVAALVERLRANPSVHLVAGVPASGRNLDQYRRQQETNRSLWGNLYLASAAFLDGVRDRGLRLPIGYIGEDGLLETMAKTDYLAVPWRLRDDAVAVEAEAKFFFDSMQAADLGKYLRRRVRYSMRTLQRQLLYVRLQRAGAQALPARIQDIYDGALDALRPALGSDWPFQQLALRRLRREAVQSIQEQ